jgi:hypothetical protein
MCNSNNQIPPISVLMLNNIKFTRAPVAPQGRLYYSVQQRTVQDSPVRAHQDSASVLRPDREVAVNCSTNLAQTAAAAQVVNS